MKKLFILQETTTLVLVADCVSLANLSSFILFKITIKFNQQQLSAQTPLTKVFQLPSLKCIYLYMYIYISIYIHIQKT